MLIKKSRNEKLRYRSREEQAEKIIKILEDYTKSGLQDLTCLDIGCSTGVMSSIFQTKCKNVIAFDIMGPLVQQARSSYGLDDLYFLIADGERIPFSNKSFDVVICAQIYEHTLNQQALASEIYRVLRKDGICFFSGPNKLYVNEEHYRLPFLSWLPQSCANIYMRLFHRGTTYNIHPLNYWQLMRLFRGFTINDYTLQIIATPEKFGMREHHILFKLRKFIPQFIRSSYPLWIPNFNWVLVKREYKNEWQ